MGDSSLWVGFTLVDSPQNGSVFPTPTSEHCTLWSPLPLSWELLGVTVDSNSVSQCWLSILYEANSQRGEARNAKQSDCLSPESGEGVSLGRSATVS